MPELPNYKAPRWAWWIAAGFGSGLARFAPGTCGSLAAWAAWVGLLFLMHGFPSMALDCTLGLLTLFLILVSIATSGLVEKQTGTSDPSFIVIDEWAGMWLALWPARRMVIEAFNEAGWKYALAAMLASFLLFRLFDIWKPWPVRRLEKMPGGWGVTMDDVAAGVLAGLVLYCAQLVIITH